MPQPRIIDVTRPLQPGIGVWPGDAPFRLEWASRRADGDLANVAAVSLGMHTGTHLDAPFHLLDDGPTVDSIPIEPLLGPATVVGVQAPIDAALVADVLERTGSPDRLLFHTGAWRHGDSFPTRFPPLDPDAVTIMRTAGVVLVGTDAPSVDPFDSTDLPAHHRLLGAGICILENLLLDGVDAGEYELLALPLRIVGADASPVRALLRRR